MKKIITTIGFVIAALALAPSANALPRDVLAHDAALFCRMLDADSSPDGIAIAINSMIISGVAEQDRIAIGKYAVQIVCPEHVPALLHARDVFNDRRYVS